MLDYNIIMAVHENVCSSVNIQSLCTSDTLLPHTTKIND